MERIELDGLTLEIDGDEAPPGIWAGDYYPRVRLRIIGPNGKGETSVSLDKAQEIAMALRVIVGRARGVGAR
jgi:hypothetical protein